MSPRLFLLRFLRRWHARIGFSAMLFFLLLAITGLALNHGTALGLDAAYVHSAPLARWYGMKEQAPLAFRSTHHQLVSANGRWLLDGKAQGDELPPALGLVEVGDLVVIASEAALYLYGGDGRLVERLGREALPAVPIRALGRNSHDIVLRTPLGTFASPDALSWQTGAPATSWSEPAELPASQRRAYDGALAPGISAQQLLLDLHSGRLFGRYGPVFVDLLAFMLAALALSGAWLFVMPRRRRDRH